MGLDNVIRVPWQTDRFANVQTLIDQVNQSEISSIRHSVCAIVSVINNAASTVKELKDIIMCDPPLAARVLKTANSAYYSRNFKRTFTDIEQAVIWMGSDIIKELALSQKVCEIFDSEQEHGAYSRKNLWRHSIAAALMTRAIFRKEYGLNGESAYMAGLLHDIGLIAEDQFLGSRFHQLLELSRCKNRDLVLVELDELGYDHADAGCGICHSWGLPDELTAAVGAHNYPDRSVVDFQRISSTLFIADFFCQCNGMGYGSVPMQDEVRLDDAMQAMGLKTYALELIVKGVKHELAVMEDKGYI